METLIVKINNSANATHFIKLMKELKYVKSVDKDKPSQTSVKEYDWINPSRPAIDDEFEQMILEAEKDPLMTAEEAKAHTYKLIDKWNKKRK